MKLKHSLLIFLLVVSLVSFYSCRNKVEEPSPTGPSTFSILMIASASPNVLIARDTGQRDTSDITVRLSTFQGTPLSNETIILDVYSDMLGVMENFGYFEGNESVAVETTDGEGKIRVRYYGPTFEELIYSHPDTDLALKDPLRPPQQVLIRASLAWQGKEIIEEYAPLQVVVEDDKNFRILADPNVLYVVEGHLTSRQSTITATLNTLGGAPVMGQKVWFDIDVGPGEFKQNGRRRISAKTDENGEAIVIYLSPKSDDIPGDNTKVTIKAHLETGDPRWAHDETQIRLYRGN